MLDAAAREPATLVLGLDANAAAMVESSRRAAGPARKGGRPNARFILAAAEDPPAALACSAGLVTVRFPWGSLLRGCVGLEPGVAVGIAGVVAPGGTLELLLAAADRDGLEGIATDVGGMVAAAAGAFAPLGFLMSIGRAATDAEIAASGSSWAKRLVAGRHLRSPANGAPATNGSDRSVALVRFVRRGAR